MEKSKTWFEKTYKYIKANYTANRRLYLMIEIGFFEAVVESGFLVSDIVKK